MQNSSDYLRKADGSYLDDEAITKSIRPKGLNYTYLPSNLDQTVGRYYVHRLFTFEFPTVDDNTFTNATEYIRNGLDITLAEYPFLSGYLGPSTASDQKNAVKVVYTEHNKPGHYVTDVNFQAVTVEECEDPGFKDIPSTYEEFASIGLPVAALPGNLFCMLPKGNPSKEWVPAFTMKLTFLQESKALVMAMCFQHTLVDGTSMCTFFQQLSGNMKLAAENKTGSAIQSRLYANMMPYHRPSLRDHIGPSTVPMLPMAADAITYDVVPADDNDEVISTILVFTAETIQSIRDQINCIVHDDDGDKTKPLTDMTVSKQDCLSAMIWTAVTHARDTPGTDPSTPTYFRTAVNARDKLDPPLPADYFGNMFAHATVKSYHSVMARGGGEVSDDHPHRMFLLTTAYHAVKIRQAIAAITPRTMHERLTRIAQLDDTQATAAAIAPFDKSRGLDFGSLVGFGADIEWAIPGADEKNNKKASFCRKIMPDGKEGIANVLPRRGGARGGEEDWEVVVSLREGQMKSVVQELAGLKILKSCTI